MKKHIVAPLVLLSSITLLTSCMDKDDKKMPMIKSSTETSIPVEVVTTPIVTDTVVAPVEAPVPTPLPVEAPIAPIVPVEAPVPPSPSVENTVSPVSATRTRTETVSYKTPAGSDSVEFSVTVDGDTITSATATVKAENDISKKWQTAFVANVSTKVSGKKINDLEGMDAIGGASLTTGAFNQFVRSF
jgi:hypothetical protein